MTNEPGRINAWSYSRWKDWADCPRKAYFKHVQKIKEPSNAAMERGSMIHKQAEQYVLGEITENPFKLPQFGLKRDEPAGSFVKPLDKLRKLGASAEDKWTFTESWDQTSWFGPDAWARMGIDAYSVGNRGRDMTIVDYKTGKVRDENRKQLGLYALGAFTRDPNLRNVTTEFWYLDAGEFVKVAFHVSEREDILNAWMQRIVPMLNDTVFPTRPGMHCRYCFFRKSNNGPCEY